MRASLALGARALERGGAGAIVIASNTMQKVCGAVQYAVAVPRLNMADVFLLTDMNAGGIKPLELAVNFVDLIVEGPVVVNNAEQKQASG